MDDHFVVRMGLCGSINTEPEMRVIGEASNGKQALDLYRSLQPDITLMDLRLPLMNGLETMTAIRKEFTLARIIMLTSFDGEEDVYRAVQAGARGYILKSTQRDELLQAIRTVHAGGCYFPNEVSARLAERMGRPDLSGRESEVLALIVQGKSNKEIGAALCITEVTVKLHVSSVLNKLGVSDRTQAATAALQRGILHLD